MSQTVYLKKLKIIPKGSKNPILKKLLSYAKI